MTLKAAAHARRLVEHKGGGGRHVERFRLAEHRDEELRLGHTTNLIRHAVALVAEGEREPATRSAAKSRTRPCCRNSHSAVRDTFRTTGT